MLTIRQMMKYLRKQHHIAIKSSQTQSLRNMGYYHGYKGYRFIREAKQKIPYSNFDELNAIVNFDMQLKSLFYPKVMIIETALKSYVIEAVLDDSKSEDLDTIFNRSLTFYKTFVPGTKKYKSEVSKRMYLKSKITNDLGRDYDHGNRIIDHFLKQDRNIPIWAIFESLTLGEFGTFFFFFFVKLHTSHLLHLPTNYDADGELTKLIIFTIKDLRNAIAHNNVIFDTRFQQKAIDSRLINLLKQETHISNIDFQYIDAYFILVIYVLRKMDASKTSCRQLIISYNKAKDELRAQIPSSVWTRILGSGTKANMKALSTYISNS